MRRLRAFCFRLLDLVWSGRRERELADEIESHLALHTDEGIRTGLTPGEARRQAVLKLGGVDPVKELYRDRRRLPVLEHAIQDVRHAARTLRRHPSFTLIAVSTLALGIGANGALFQLLDAVSLRALPIEAPHQLVEIRTANMHVARGNVSIWHAGATNAIWEQVRRRQEAFAGVFAWSPAGARLSRPNEEPRFASVLMVSGDFFDVLGVRPVLGRTLTSVDDQPGCAAPGAVISHAFWQREFGGDPTVIGRRLMLSEYPYEIVGVAPREFTGLDVGRRFDLVVPLCAEALPPGSTSRLDSGVDWFLIVMGRLKPGWTIEQADAHLAAISPAVFDASLPANYPAENIAQYRAFELTTLAAANGISGLREQYVDSLWFLQATAALVLLIGCANLANLMLARFTARERDVAVRVALGAGRGRLVQMLLAESLLLSLAGGLAGAWLAGGLSQFLVASLAGDSTTLYLDLPRDWRLVGFTAATAIVVSAMLGLLPAWRTTRVPPGAILRAGGRGITEGRGRVGARQVLMVSQVGLSFVLVAGALLFGRTLNNLMTQDIGLRLVGVTVAYVDLSRVEMPAERRPGFKLDMMRRLEQTPGVVAVAETSVVPLSGSASDNEVWVEEGGSRTSAVSLFMSTSARYFATMEMAVVAGRPFDDGVDTLASPRVAVVNEAFVRKYFHGASPVGKPFWREARADGPVTSYEVVGVVKDAKYRNLRQDLLPIVYLPISQEPRSPRFAQLLIRTSMPSATAIPALKAALKQQSADIVPTFQDLSEMVSDSLVRDRLVAVLSGFFGALAILLATLGLYGVVSCAVTRRTKEIGICIALGATSTGIATMIVREALVLVAAGCVAGSVLALTFARSITKLVYGLSPSDPVTLVATALLLAGVALVASLAPARRAATLDPIAALRLD